MKVPLVNLRMCFTTAPRCTEIKMQDKKGAIAATAETATAAAMR